MSAQRTLAAFALNPPWGRVGLRSGADWHALTAGLLVLDTAALGAAFGLAYLVRFEVEIPLLESLPPRIAFYSWVSFWAVPAWLAIFGLYGLYDRHHLFAGFQEYTRVVNACTVGMVVVVMISFLDVALVISRGWLLLTWGLAIALVCAARFTLRRVLRQLRQHGHLITPTVIVGANEEGRAVAEQFLSDHGSGIQILGFVDGDQPAGTPVVDQLHVLGSLHDLVPIVHAQRIRQVVVATTAVGRDDLLDLYRTLGQVDEVDVRLSSGLFEILTTGVRVQEVSYVPLMTPRRVRITGADAFLKSILDYLSATLGIVVLSPLLLLITLLVKLDSPGPVLHRRRVLGRSGKPFDAFKFRTMRVDADRLLTADAELRAGFERDQKLKRDPRVTRVGAILRRTSLDELPQLVNVLRGEMSLIGPRMIAPEEAGRYGKWQLNLLTVKPGITGPWQVRGRSDLSYEERVRLSMHYIRNYTIWLDLEILLRTLPVVLQGKGAY